MALDLVESLTGLQEGEEILLELRAQRVSATGRAGGPFAGKCYHGDGASSD